MTTKSKKLFKIFGHVGFIATVTALVVYYGNRIVGRKVERRLMEEEEIDFKSKLLKEQISAAAAEAKTDYEASAEAEADEAAKAATKRDEG